MKSLKKLFNINKDQEPKLILPVIKYFPGTAIGYAAEYPGQGQHSFSVNDLANIKDFQTVTKESLYAVEEARFEKARFFKNMMLNTAKRGIDHLFECTDQKELTAIIYERIDLGSPRLVGPTPSQPGVLYTELSPGEVEARIEVFKAEQKQEAHLKSLGNQENLDNSLSFS
ncbi:MAG: hypothetical protein AAF182_04700 [Pseudomonadota bacterium]